MARFLFHNQQSNELVQSSILFRWGNSPHDGPGMITSWKQQFHSSAIRIATELGDMGLFSGNFSGVISGSGLLQTRTTDLGSSFLRFIFEPE